jgi:hypothetical protein
MIGFVRGIYRPGRSAVIRPGWAAQPAIVIATKQRFAKRDSPRLIGVHYLKDNLRLSYAEEANRPHPIGWQSLPSTHFTDYEYFVE